MIEPSCFSYLANIGTATVGNSSSIGAAEVGTVCSRYQDGWGWRSGEEGDGTQVMGLSTLSCSEGTEPGVAVSRVLVIQLSFKTELINIDHIQCWVQPRL